MAYIIMHHTIPSAVVPLHGPPSKRLSISIAVGLASAPGLLVVRCLKENPRKSLDAVSPPGLVPTVPAALSLAPLVPFVTAGGDWNPLDPGEVPFDISRWGSSLK
jgi:hypothetical protein